MPMIEWRWPWQGPDSKPEPVRPPKVAGTRAPLNIEEIDFRKAHDFHFRFGYQNDILQVFEKCRLIGFTTPMSDGDSSAAWEERTHNRWIALERPDGRRVYVPRDGLIYIEDSECS